MAQASAVLTDSAFARRVSPILLAILSFALLAPSANADVDVRVGGVGCTFSTIQQAINNANNANGITNILIARNGSYNSQAIDIKGKNVRLIGGYADCNQTVRDNIHTVLSGAGGSARSILNIYGSTSVVALYNLRLTGGDESQIVLSGTADGGLASDEDNYGGAIDITGGPHSLIYLENTHLFSNGAGIGGALSVRGNSSNINATFVWLSYNTIIKGNAAREFGGGVYCSDATLHFKAGNASIYDNTVGNSEVAGNGGGIFANHCQVRVAATTEQLVSGGAIYNNYAFGSGGGIYAYGSRTRVDIYNVDPIYPTKIFRNFAKRNGGGMNIEQGAKVYVWDGIIEGNRAYSGGGAVSLYDDGQSDLSLFYMIQNINTPDFGFTPPSGSPDSLDFAFQCSRPQNCSLLKGNLSRNGSDVNQDGSVFRISTDGDGASAAVLLGARMTGNIGRNAVKAISFNGSNSESTFNANGSLLDNNTNSTVLLDGGRNTRIQVLSSTITNNIVPASNVINADLRCAGVNYFSFQGNILHQPGKRVTSAMPEAGCLRYVIGSVLEFIPFPDQSTFRVADPVFTNAAGGDFTLQGNSPALDFSPHSGLRATRDARERRVDLFFDANEFGPVDLGAYEMPDLRSQFLSPQR